MTARICDVKCPDKDFTNCKQGKCPFLSAVGTEKAGKNLYCSNPKVVA